MFRVAAHDHTLCVIYFGDRTKYMKPCLLLLVLLCLGGCVLFIDPDYEALMLEICSRIDPKTEAVGEDVWQTPDETRVLGTADCEDYALLMLDEGWRRYGVSGMFVVIKSESSEVRHAVALFDRYYDPAHCRSFDLLPDGCHVERVVSYWTALAVATYCK